MLKPKDVSRSKRTMIATHYAGDDSATVESTSQKYGISHSLVRAILNGARIPIRKNASKESRQLIILENRNKTYRKITRNFDRGMEPVAIAEKLKVSAKRVYAALCHAGHAYYTNQQHLLAIQRKIIWKRQHKLCACCGTYLPLKRADVDHCHTTMKIRGVVCSNCNVGIGLLGDTIKSVKKAIKYLEKFEKIGTKKAAD